MSRQAISRSHCIHPKSTTIRSPFLRISPRLALPHHHLHTSQCLKSPLFNLAGLSVSRESQYLSKERGIPRTEFHPHLELIRSSEVDTQQAPGARKYTLSTANTIPPTTDDNTAPLSQQDSPSTANTTPPATEDSNNTGLPPKESVVIRTADDTTSPLSPECVVIPQAEYAALKHRVGKLQQKLGLSIAERRRLQTDIDENVGRQAYGWMAFILFLSVGFAFWVDLPRGSSVKEKSPRKGAGKVDPEGIGDESRQGTEDGESWTWSTWFWASGEDEQ
ncbi:MAG: hypothetical protein Q9208_001518 [Pyrenodesmia sp. 3 TL-2023]